MNAVSIRMLTVVWAACVLMPGDAPAQWLKQPTKGVPRTADGKPNLTAAAPRAADGKPDLSGLWETGPKYETDFTPADAHSWALAKSRERRSEPRRRWMEHALSSAGTDDHVQRPAEDRAGARGGDDPLRGAEQLPADLHGWPCTAERSQSDVAGILHRTVGRRHLRCRDDRIQRQVMGRPARVSAYGGIAGHGAVPQARFRPSGCADHVR